MCDTWPRYTPKTDVPRNINPRGGRSIFAGCLFFEIGSSSANFLDLEQCRKPSSGHMTIAAGRLFGRRPIFLPNGQNFLPIPRRPSSGHRQVTAGGPVDRRRTKMNPPITVRSLLDGQPVIGGALPMFFWFNLQLEFVISNVFKSK